jgi:enamine deaminase RidA (YjgF/YER057c/UK114 family)
MQYKMIEKEYIEPNEGFSQTVIVKTGNFKTLYISGQIGAGNDLEEQTITTFQNLEKQLQNCNATFKDVVKMNTYIVNFNSEIDLPIFRKVRKEFLGNENYPASTLVGVESLGRKEWLIEIEAIAIVE